MRFTSKEQREAVMAKLRGAYGRAIGAGQHTIGVGKDYAYQVAMTPARAAGYAKGLGHQVVGHIGSIDPMAPAGHIAAVAASVVEDMVKKSLDLKMAQAEDIISGEMDKYEDRLRRNLARRIQTAQSIATRQVRPIPELATATPLTSVMPRSTLDLSGKKYRKLRRAFDQNLYKTEMKKMLKSFEDRGVDVENIGLLMHMMDMQRDLRKAETQKKNLQAEIRRQQDMFDTGHKRP